MKRILTMILALTMALSLAACGGSKNDSSASTDDNKAASDAKPITVIFYSPNSGNYASEAVKVMASTLTERSSGSMVGNCIEAGSAGTQEEAVQAMMSGDMNVIVNTIDRLENQIPGSSGSWLSLPFLFDSDEQAEKDYYNGWMLDKMKELALAGGVHVYDYIYNGFKCISFTKDVHSYADWQNMKVRVPANDLFNTLCAAYGMQTVSGIDMYTSLQNGTVDAVLQSEEGHQTFKLEEVIKELVLIHDTFGSNLYSSSEAWYQSLTDEQKQILNEVITEVAAEYNQKSMDAIDTYVNETLPNAGVEVVIPDDAWKNEMKKAGIPLWESFLNNDSYDAELREKLRTDYYEVNFADVLN